MAHSINFFRAPCPGLYSAPLVHHGLCGNNNLLYKRSAKILQPLLISNKPLSLKKAVTICDRRHHQSRDHWTPNMRFPIGSQYEPTMYLARSLTYWASKILGLQPWHFVVAWRHMPRDHMTPLLTVRRHCLHTSLRSVDLRTTSSDNYVCSVADSRGCQNISSSIHSMPPRLL